MACVSVVIADRHPVFLCGLMSVLSGHDNFNVVASCRNGSESIQAIRDLSPDIALLDNAMPGLSGLDILAAARAEGLGTRVLLLTAAPEPREFFIAAAWGAYGMVPKDVRPDILVHGLQRVAGGRRLSSRAFLQGRANSREGSSRKRGDDNMVTTLSERERQIVRLVTEGMSNKEVGRRLTLTEGTIKVHLHNIYQKLAINNRTALTAMAISQRDEWPLAV